MASHAHRRLGGGDGGIEHWEKTGQFIDNSSRSQKRSARYSTRQGFCFAPLLFIVALKASIEQYNHGQGTRRLPTGRTNSGFGNTCSQSEPIHMAATTLDNGRWQTHSGKHASRMFSLVPSQRVLCAPACDLYFVHSRPPYLPSTAV